MKVERKVVVSVLDHILFGRSGRVTQDLIFVFHYFTSNLIVLFFLIFYNIYGSPVRCRFNNYHTEKNEPVGWFNDEILDDICWNDNIMVDQQNATGTADINRNQRRGSFHWIYAIIILQLLLFNLPRMLWSVFEGKKMKSLVEEFKIGYRMSLDNKEVFKEYLAKSFKTYSNQFYVSMFVVCEVLNVVCTAIHIFGLNYLSDYHFSELGFEMLSAIVTPLQMRYDGMAELFPVLAKCNFNDFGESQGGEMHDGFCVIPINMVSERYFVFVWCYLHVLIIIGSIQLVYRLVTILSITVRSYTLWENVIFYPVSVIHIAIRRLTYGEWFILVQVTKRITPWCSAELIDGIVDLNDE